MKYIVFIIFVCMHLRDNHHALTRQFEKIEDEHDDDTK
jgi:hypothetical protein